MNSLRTAVILGLAFLAIGCPARSISPLFSDNDTIVDPRLIGIWSHSDDGTLSFERSKGNSYLATLRDKNDSSSYTVYLGKLGNAWFIESSSEQSGSDHHLLPAYLVHRIWLYGDSLSLSALRSDWLREMIDAGKANIPNIRRDGEIILTASTEELQKFVSRYADSAFTERNTYYRKQ